MSYAGQIHSLRVPIEPGWPAERLREAFVEMYRQEFGNTLGDVNTPGEQILVERFDRGGNLDTAFGGGDGFTLSTFGGARSQLAREIVVEFTFKGLDHLVRDVLKEAGDAVVVELADAREAVLSAAERLVARAT